MNTCTPVRVAFALSALAAVTLVWAVPAAADIPILANLAKYEAAGYFRAESLDILLLAQQKSGRPLDPDKLMAAAGNGWSGSLRQRYERYLQSSDRTERFEMKQAITYELQDRSVALNRARGYLLPLASRLSSFDPARGGLSMQLSLDLYPSSGRRDFQCAGLQPGSALAACMSAGNLNETDPIYNFLPLANSDLAGNIKSLYDAGYLGIYALCEPSSLYQTAAAIPSEMKLLGVSGNQPTVIVGLLLVDVSTGKVVNTARAQPVQRTGLKSVKDAPLPVGTSAPGVAPVPAPQPESPLVAGNAKPPVLAPLTDVGRPEVPPGAQNADSPPFDSQMQDIDRFLSLLSFTIYATPEQVIKVGQEVDALKMKADRIGRDQGRFDSIKQKELEKLALKTERKQRKLELLRAMLDLKEDISGKYGARRIEGPRLSGITYERYRLPDKKEVIVFRGTSSAVDWETDFHLAMTPETISELGAAMGKGRSLADELANKMRDGAAPEGSGKPEAFVAADRLVAGIVRSGVPAGRIVLTGHSLGGGLAQYAGIKQGGGTIVTFNTAPLSQQLRDSLPLAKHTGQIRNYVAVVPGPPGSGKVTMDPISQRAGATEMTTLQVIGPQYTVEVCKDLDSPEYQSFTNTAQGFITRRTVSWVAGDKYKPLQQVAIGGGALAGYGTASTDEGSSAIAGYKKGKEMAKNVAGAANCFTHPFLCSAKVAAGGIASVAANVYLAKIWTLYAAHRMKGLFDALNGYASPGCNADPF